MREVVRIDVDGSSRGAIFTAPPGDAGHKPLLIFFHGKGGTAEWALDESRLVEYAGREGFCLLVPDALPLDPSKEPRFLTNPQVWNSDPHNPLHASMPDDVKFVGRLIDFAIRERPIDPRRIYLTGFSNGAGMTFRCASELNGRIAAIAPVAGNCLVRPIVMERPIPTLWLMGADDPLMPFAGGMVNSPWGKTYFRPAMEREASRLAEASGMAAESKSPIEIRGASGFQFQSSDGIPVTLLKVADLGHHWPGGLGRLNPKLFGPANAVFPGNEVIWEFLRQFRLPEAASTVPA